MCTDIGVLQDSFAYVLNWTLITLILTASFLLSVILRFEEKQRQALRISITMESQDNPENLEYEITSKSAQLRASMNRIKEIKETISEMEDMSEQILTKYNELLSQLKSELAKTEKESKTLHMMISQMMSKKLEVEAKSQEKPADILMSFAIPITNAPIESTA